MLVSLKQIRAGMVWLSEYLELDSEDTMNFAISELDKIIIASSGNKVIETSVPQQ